MSSVFFSLDLWSLWANKTRLNLIIFNFNVRGKLTNILILFEFSMYNQYVYDVTTRSQQPVNVVQNKVN